jgi:flagellar hook-associated protein 3 FlgL
MSVNRIATSNQYSSVLADLMRAQGRQIDAQKEFSSGKRGDDLLGFADRARSLVATKAVQTRTQGLVAQLQSVDVKLESQQLGLENVADSAESLRQAIGSALASGRADGLMNEVQTNFSTAVQGLNSRYGDGYLFSGGQVDTPPVNISSLAQLAAASPIDDIFDNGTLVTSSRTDESATVQTGFLADAVGKPLMQSMQRIQQFQDGPTGSFGGPLTDAQRTFLESEYAALNTVADGATTVVAQGGSVQKQIETAIKSQTARAATLENTLGDLTDVDIAEAAAKLTQAQLAVQASAQVFLSLKDMSLLNYLK